MTVRLTVKQRSEEGGPEKPSVVLLDDEVITLGRDSVCQVVLNQQAVSRTHARISKDRSLFFVEDLGSSYGTTVNGKKISKGEKQLLRNGDVIVIAQFDVTFDRVVDGKSEGEGGGSTQFVAKQVVRDVMRGLGAGGEQPYVRVMNGPKEGQRLELADAQEYVIGRDDDVELVFKDDLVSRRHAKLRRDISGTHVEDLGSRNGIKVNRKRVKKKTLKDRDELEVGGVRLLFIDPTEVRESLVVMPDEAEDEATSATGADEEAVPPPEDVPRSKSDLGATRSGEASESPSQKAAAIEPSASDAGEEESVSEAEPPAEEEPVAEEPEAAGSELSARPLLDFKNRQTLIVVGVAGAMLIVAVVILAALFAGA